VRSMASHPRSGRRRPSRADLGGCRMASPHLPRPAARQAGPATRARPQPARRPRGWCGLLVLVLIVVRVAAVGTHASADSADDVPLPESFGEAAGTGTGTRVGLGHAT